ncbi:hypothetical protein BESB_074580 [Besnoitia besnoiti]|uniref:Uncharacterized protein n=1 Tax=Besnoitia besnoiti TaxID=94643 RepID=A0A2A9MED1_BESBE|nr:uncharacterized protein BESB_074580 [Besnoitia besnoiti]PFH34306.1 hypothetical protein BESB_074580 [Besnoitia besnoiti]
MSAEGGAWGWYGAGRRRASSDIAGRTERANLACTPRRAWWKLGLAGYTSETDLPRRGLLSPVTRQHAAHRLREGDGLGAQEAFRCHSGEDDTRGCKFGSLEAVVLGDKVPKLRARTGRAGGDAAGDSTDLCAGESQGPLFMGRVASAPLLDRSCGAHGLREETPGSTPPGSVAVSCTGLPQLRETASRGGIQARGACSCPHCCEHVSHAIPPTASPPGSTLGEGAGRRQRAFSLKKYHEEPRGSWRLPVSPRSITGRREERKNRVPLKRYFRPQCPHGRAMERAGQLDTTSTRAAVFADRSALRRLALRRGMKGTSIWTRALELLNSTRSTNIAPGAADIDVYSFVFHLASVLGAQPLLPDQSFQRILDCPSFSVAAYTFRPHTVEFSERARQSVLPGHYLGLGLVSPLQRSLHPRTWLWRASASIAELRSTTSRVRSWADPSRRRSDEATAGERASHSHARRLAWQAGPPSSPLLGIPSSCGMRGFHQAGQAEHARKLQQCRIKGDESSTGGGAPAQPPLVSQHSPLRRFASMSSVVSRLGSAAQKLQTSARDTLVNTHTCRDTSAYVCRRSTRRDADHGWDIGSNVSRGPEGTGAREADAPGALHPSVACQSCSTGGGAAPCHSESCDALLRTTGKSSSRQRALFPEGSGEAWPRARPFTGEDQTVEIGGGSMWVDKRSPRADPYPESSRLRQRPSSPINGKPHAVANGSSLLAATAAARGPLKRTIALAVTVYGKTRDFLSEEDPLFFEIGIEPPLRIGNRLLDSVNIWLTQPTSSPEAPAAGTHQHSGRLYQTFASLSHFGSHQPQRTDAIRVPHDSRLIRRDGSRSPTESWRRSSTEAFCFPAASGLFAISHPRTHNSLSSLDLSSFPRALSASLECLPERLYSSCDYTHPPSPASLRGMQALSISPASAAAAPAGRVSMLLRPGEDAAVEEACTALTVEFSIASANHPYRHIYESKGFSLGQAFSDESAVLGTKLVLHRSNIVDSHDRPVASGHPLHRVLAGMAPPYITISAETASGSVSGDATCPTESLEQITGVSTAHSGSRSKPHFTCPFSRNATDAKRRAATAEVWPLLEDTAASRSLGASDAGSLVDPCPQDIREEGRKASMRWRLVAYTGAPAETDKRETGRAFCLSWRSASSARHGATGCPPSPTNAVQPSASALASCLSGRGLRSIQSLPVGRVSTACCAPRMFSVAQYTLPECREDWVVPGDRQPSLPFGASAEEDSPISVDAEPPSMPLRAALQLAWGNTSEEAGLRTFVWQTSARTVKLFAPFWVVNRHPQPLLVVQPSVGVPQRLDSTDWRVISCESSGATCSLRLGVAEPLHLSAFVGTPAERSRPSDGEKDAASTETPQRRQHERAADHAANDGGTGRGQISSGHAAKSDERFTTFPERQTWGASDRRNGTTEVDSCPTERKEGAEEEKEEAEGDAQSSESARLFKRGPEERQQNHSDETQARAVEGGSTLPERSSAVAVGALSAPFRVDTAGRVTQVVVPKGDARRSIFWGWLSHSSRATSPTDTASVHSRPHWLGVTVSRAPPPFVRTNIINVFSRFTLVNNLSFDLWIAEGGSARPTGACHASTDCEAEAPGREGRPGNECQGGCSRGAVAKGEGIIQLASGHQVAFHPSQGTRSGGPSIIFSLLSPILAAVTAIPLQQVQTELSEQKADGSKCDRQVEGGTGAHGGRGEVRTVLRKARGEHAVLQDSSTKDGGGGDLRAMWGSIEERTGDDGAPRVPMVPDNNPLATATSVTSSSARKAGLPQFSSSLWDEGEVMSSNESAGSSPNTECTSPARVCRTGCQAANGRPRSPPTGTLASSSRSRAQNGASAQRRSSEPPSASCRTHAWSSEILINRVCRFQIRLRCSPQGGASRKDESDGGQRGHATAQGQPIPRTKKPKDDKAPAYPGQPGPSTALSIRGGAQNCWRPVHTEDAGIGNESAHAVEENTGNDTPIMPMNGLRLPSMFGKDPYPAPLSGRGARRAESGRQTGEVQTLHGVAERPSATDSPVHSGWSRRAFSIVEVSIRAVEDAALFVCFSKPKRAEFLLVNQSRRVVQFCQAGAGIKRQAQKDFLLPGEKCDFAWQEPQRTRRLMRFNVVERGHVYSRTCEIEKVKQHRSLQLPKRSRRRSVSSLNGDAAPSNGGLGNDRTPPPARTGDKLFFVTDVHQGRRIVIISDVCPRAPSHVKSPSWAGSAHRAAYRRRSPHQPNPRSVADTVANLPPGNLTQDAERICGEDCTYSRVDDGTCDRRDYRRGDSSSSGLETNQRGFPNEITLLKRLSLISRHLTRRSSFHKQNARGVHRVCDSYSGREQHTGASDTGGPWSDDTGVADMPYRARLAMELDRPRTECKSWSDCDDAGRRRYTPVRRRSTPEVPLSQSLIIEHTCPPQQKSCGGSKVAGLGSLKVLVGMRSAKKPVTGVASRRHEKTREDDILSAPGELREGVASATGLQSGLPFPQAVAPFEATRALVETHTLPHGLADSLSGRGTLRSLSRIPRMAATWDRSKKNSFASFVGRSRGSGESVDSDLSHRAPSSSLRQHLGAEEAVRATCGICSADSSQFCPAFATCSLGSQLAAAGESRGGGGARPAQGSQLALRRPSDMRASWLGRMRKGSRKGAAQMQEMSREDFSLQTIGAAPQMGGRVPRSPRLYCVPPLFLEAGERGLSPTRPCFMEPMDRRDSSCSSRSGSLDRFLCHVLPRASDSESEYAFCGSDEPTKRFRRRQGYMRERSTGVNASAHGRDNTGTLRHLSEPGADGVGEVGMTARSQGLTETETTISEQDAVEDSGSDDAADPCHVRSSDVSHGNSDGSLASLDLQETDDSDLSDTSSSNNDSDDEFDKHDICEECTSFAFPETIPTPRSRDAWRQSPTTTGGVSGNRAFTRWPALRSASGPVLTSPGSRRAMSLSARLCRTSASSVSHTLGPLKERGTHSLRSLRSAASSTCSGLVSRLSVGESSGALKVRPSIWPGLLGTRELASQGGGRGSDDAPATTARQPKDKTQRKRHRRFQSWGERREDLKSCLSLGDKTGSPGGLPTALRAREEDGGNEGNKMDKCSANELRSLSEAANDEDRAYRDTALPSGLRAFILRPPGSLVLRGGQRRTEERLGSHEAHARAAPRERTRHVEADWETAWEAAQSQHLSRHAAPTGQRGCGLPERFTACFVRCRTSFPRLGSQSRPLGRPNLWASALSTLERVTEAEAHASSPSKSGLNAVAYGCRKRLSSETTARRQVNSQPTRKRSLCCLAEARENAFGFGLGRGVERCHSSPESFNRLSGLPEKECSFPFLWHKVCLAPGEGDMREEWLVCPREQKREHQRVSAHVGGGLISPSAEQGRYQDRCGFGRSINYEPDADADLGSIVNDHERAERHPRASASFFPALANVTFNLEVQAQGCGVSLVDDTPRELLYIGASGIRVAARCAGIPKPCDLSESSTRQHGSTPASFAAASREEVAFDAGATRHASGRADFLFSVQKLQVDNGTRGARHETVLRPCTEDELLQHQATGENKKSKTAATLGEGILTGAQVENIITSSIQPYIRWGNATRERHGASIQFSRRDHMRTSGSPWDKHAERRSRHALAQPNEGGAEASLEGHDGGFLRVQFGGRSGKEATVLHYFDCALAPVSIHVEVDTTFELIRYLLRFVQLRNMYLRALQATSIREVREASSLDPYTEGFRKLRSLPRVPPIRIAYKKPLYVRTFCIRPIQILLSTRAPREHKRHLGMTGRDIVALKRFQVVGGGMTDVTNFPMKFRLVLHQALFNTTDQLGEALLRLYAQQGLRQVHKLVASIDIIGNPLGLVTNLSAGARALVREPWIKGPDNADEVADTPRAALWRGIRYFLAAVGSGLCGSVSKLVSGLFRLFEMLRLVDGDSLRGMWPAAVRVTRDGIENPRNFFDGMKYGSLGALQLLFASWIGVVVYPLRGARETGPLGLVTGLVHGMTSLFFGTFGGCLNLIQSVAHGIYQSLTHAQTIYRIRPARCFPADHTIQQYGFHVSRAMKILRDSFPAAAAGSLQPIEAALPLPRMLPPRGSGVCLSSVPRTLAALPVRPEVTTGSTNAYPIAAEADPLSRARGRDAGEACEVCAARVKFVGQREVLRNAIVLGATACFCKPEVPLQRHATLAVAPESGLKDGCGIGQESRRLGCDRRSAGGARQHNTSSMIPGGPTAEGDSGEAQDYVAATAEMVLFIRNGRAQWVARKCDISDVNVFCSSSVHCVPEPDGVTGAGGADPGLSGRLGESSTRATTHCSSSADWDAWRPRTGARPLTAAPSPLLQMQSRAESSSSREHLPLQARLLSPESVGQRDPRAWLRTTVDDAGVDPLAQHHELPFSKADVASRIYRRRPSLDMRHVADTSMQDERSGGLQELPETENERKVLCETATPGGSLPISSPSPSTASCEEIIVRVTVVNRAGLPKDVLTDPHSAYRTYVQEGSGQKGEAEHVIGQGSRRWMTAKGLLQQVLVGSDKLAESYAESQYLGEKHLSLMRNRYGSSRRNSVTVETPGLPGNYLRTHDFLTAERVSARFSTATRTRTSLDGTHTAGQYASGEKGQEGCEAAGSGSTINPERGVARRDRNRDLSERGSRLLSAPGNETSAVRHAQRTNTSQHTTMEFERFLFSSPASGGDRSNGRDSEHHLDACRRAMRQPPGVESSPRFSSTHDEDTRLYAVVVDGEDDEHHGCLSERDKHLENCVDERNLEQTRHAKAPQMPPWARGDGDEMSDMDGVEQADVLSRGGQRENGKRKTQTKTERKKPQKCQVSESATAMLHRMVTRWRNKSAEIPLTVTFEVRVTDWWSAAEIFAFISPFAQAALKHGRSYEAH